MRRLEGFPRVQRRAVGGREGGAFSLVELLVVISIIALLVTIVMPSLGRALVLARRASCASTLHNLGKIEVLYVQEYNSYPYLCPWPWVNPRLRVPGLDIAYTTVGWPKLNGILDAAGIGGEYTRMTTWGMRYYGQPIKDIWDGCFCPNMDAAEILRTADHAGNFGYDSNLMYWTSFHPWAVGYQWSPYLRADYPNGRYPKYLMDHEPNAWRWQWIGHHANLPIGTYYTQAVRPDELEDAAIKAEAWDSWDLESAPRIDWWGSKQQMGPLTPGWHAGVASLGGKAMFNANRHEGSPNILYADGHVAADAARPMVPADGLTGELEGTKAVTYEEWDDTFGTFRRLVPQCKFEE